MPLVFSAITPHSPVLVPTIENKKLSNAQKTIDALKELETLLYASKVDTLVVISSHAHTFEDRFEMNLSQKYETDFSQFGDFATKQEFFADSEILLHVKSRVEHTDIKVHLVSESKLDPGISTSLYYLASHLPGVRLVPLSSSTLDFETHFRYGQYIQKEIQKSNKRVGVVVSGDLSHSLSVGAPAGLHEYGEQFDQKLLKILKENNSKELLSFDADFLKDASETVFKPLLILSGIFDDLSFCSRVLSYEAPFGVGYLVAHFNSC